MPVNAMAAAYDAPSAGLGRTDNPWLRWAASATAEARPDAFSDNPRVARVYDPRGPDRSAPDTYVALAAELGARTVLDVGGGTGTLACRLASEGSEVLGA